MAKKTFKFAVTVGIADAASGTPEVRDTDGRLVIPAALGIRYLPPGTPIEMEEVEGNVLLLRHGPYVGTLVTVPPTTITQTLSLPKR